MYIIANLKNFTLTHEFCIFDEENQLVDKFATSMKQLPELIVEACKKYNVNSVSLMGNKNFSKKVGEDIKAINLAKYELNINVQYI